MGEDFQFQENRFLFRIPEVGAFLIIDGRQVLIDPAPDANLTLIRLYLLGSVMGILLHLRGILPLHASAIAHEGRAIAFLGASGRGKSTIAQALRQRGYPVLADDICALQILGKDRSLVLPGYNNLKLPRDSARELASVIPDDVLSIEEEGKYHLPLKADLFSKALPLERIYLLEPSTVSRCSIQVLQGSQKLMPLIYNTYRAQVIPVLGMRDMHFSRCTTVSSHCRVAKVIRPREPFSLQALVATLETDFRSSRIVNS